MLNTPTPSRAQQVDLLRQLLDALLEAVALGGTEGVPGGTLYATLMGMGVDLRTFEKLMGILVESGRVRKVGHLYVVVEALNGC
jgi:hypothetical protein